MAIAPVRRNHSAAFLVLLAVSFVAFLYQAISFTLPSRASPLRVPVEKPLSVSEGGPIAAAGLGLLIALTGNVPQALANAPGKWGYNEKGKDWASEGFPACDGKAQTPIDLEDKDVQQVGGDSIIKLLSYKATDTEFFNNGGKNVQANGNFGSMKLPDGEYEVKQFHFHFPAEHEVAGKLAAGELHIVHQKKGSEGTDDLAVVGILMKQSEASDGPEGAWLKKLGFGASLPAEDGAKISVARMDLNAFASQFGGGFYHYRGSLTTPPCSETVHWYVLKRGIPITKAMIDSFKVRFPANNRGILPLNGRTLANSAIQLAGEY